MNQRGFTLIEAGIFLLILAAVGGAATAIVHTYNHALERAQAAEADSKVKGLALTDQLVANAELRTKQELLNQQLADRAALDGRINALERKFNAKVASLYAQSPEARKWAATAIPDDVRRVVRDRAGPGSDNDKNNPRPAADRVVKPDAGTAVPRSAQYQRRPADVRNPAGVSGK